MSRILKFLSLLVVFSLLAACNLPWPTYTNTTYQFQLQYPPGGSIETDTPTAARIQLPFSAGTNLLDKYLDIDVTEGVYPCTSPYTSGYSDSSIVPTYLTINGLDWVKESAGEGAAGSVYEWIAYSTANGDLCVSLTFVLHSANPSIYYPAPTPTFNLANESAFFLTIVNTFVWLSGTPMPTPVATSTPTPVPTFTPTAAMIFFRPHLNAYCRSGPNSIFSSITLAMKGQDYPIDGRNLENSWFYIMISPQVGCWVPRDVGTPSGDTARVRVLAEIPTPTFTPPPPQTFNCAQYDNNYKACSNYPNVCSWQGGTGSPLGKCVNK